MNRIDFGPLVLKQRLSYQETMDIKDSFSNQTKENLITELPDLHERGVIDPNDERYNKILYPYIRKYLDVYNFKGGYKIVSLWGNVYRKNDMVPPHIHTCCDLSFVLFLKMPPIEMLDQKKEEGVFVLRYGDDAPFGQKIAPITNQVILPKEGELIIFPQNLIHYTLPIKHPQAERISISGNILLN